MLDENEFLSPHGIRALSKYHEQVPYVLHVDGADHVVDYEPGESTSGLFGGNSNWRGPVWFPVNYLLIESLQKFHHYYGDDLKVECPTGSGIMMDLWEVSQELSRRLTRLFLKTMMDVARSLARIINFKPTAFPRPAPLSRILSRRRRPRPGCLPPNRLTGLVAKLLQQSGE